MKGENSSFLAYIFRMPLIKRWSLMYVAEEENIAEHSHQVAVVAHLLAVIKNTLFDGNIDEHRLATMALYHDASEVITQDVVATVKYSSPTLLKEFKKLETEAEHHVFKTLPDELKEAFRPVLLSEQLDGDYKRLLKAADVMCAYIKSVSEVKKHQNREFNTVEQKLKKTLDELKVDLPEVDYFLNTFIEGCISTIDEISEY